MVCGQHSWHFWSVSSFIFQVFSRIHHMHMKFRNLEVVTMDSKNTIWLFIESGENQHFVLGSSGHILILFLLLAKSKNCKVIIAEAFFARRGLIKHSQSFIKTNHLTIGFHLMHSFH